MTRDLFAYPRSEDIPEAEEEGPQDREFLAALRDYHRQREALSAMLSTRQAEPHQHLYKVHGYHAEISQGWESRDGGFLRCTICGKVHRGYGCPPDGVMVGTKPPKPDPDND